MEKRFLCLDIGGTSIKYAVCSEEGQMLDRGKGTIGEDLDTFWIRSSRSMKRREP